MLTYSKEGKLCLEDADGAVELDFAYLVSCLDVAGLIIDASKDEPGDGLYTEGSFALVEGEYTENGILEVIALGQPPCETRETARSIYGHIDFLGKGATSLAEDVSRPFFLLELVPKLYQSQFAVRINEELSTLNFFCLSDVWLDHPQTLPGLQKMFDNCVENSFIPKVIILCGNFTCRAIHGNARDVSRYQGRFAIQTG